MTVPTTSWSENSPAGSDNISLGDNRMREMKTQLREVIGVDHKFESTGQDADNGKHNQVSLLEAEDIGTGTSGKPILGAQTINSVPELVYTTEDDADIQITKAGVLKPSTSTVLADWSAIMNLVYPVGSVVTLGVSTNPATLYGVGTWTAIVGKVIVGLNGSETEFDTLNETGGEKTHTLSTAELATHRHFIASSSTTSDETAVSASQTATSVKGTGSDTKYILTGVATEANVGLSSNTGSGTAHNNLQPYIVKYVWERTA